MTLIRSVAGGWRCLACDALLDSRIGHDPCPEVPTQGMMRLDATEKLIVALLDIIAFKPTEGTGDAHTQIAVFAKHRASDAIREWQNVPTSKDANGGGQ